MPTEHLAARRHWISAAHRLTVQLAVAGVAYGAVLALNGWSTYGLWALAFLAVRLAVVAGNRVHRGPPRSYAVVVPSYNETASSLDRCLRSIAAQVHPPVAVVVVDDHSATWHAEALAPAMRRFQEAWIPATILHLATNSGKREAIAAGRALIDDDFDVLVCVDSDTDLDRDATRWLTAAFNDPRVDAATGLVLAANRDRNILTRLIDVRYVGAFEFDRASQSALRGAMVCACGSLAGYRTAMFDRWVDDFTGQTFAGATCTFGDDRRLTSYALREGRAVYVRDAVARTDVPESMGHFTRQQVRWSRSWGRETALALREQPWWRPGRWMITVEGVTWTIFTVSLIAAVFRNAVNVDASHVAVIAAAAVARSGAYAHRKDLTAGQRALGVAISPLYSVLNLWVLLPLRLWALATMRRTTWGTR